MTPEQRVLLSDVCRTLRLELTDAEHEADADVEPAGMRWIDGYVQGLLFAEDTLMRALGRGGE